MEFWNRKEKVTIINAPIHINLPMGSESRNCSIVRDVSWCSIEKSAKLPSALMKDFSLPEQANNALANGSLRQKNWHACNIADRKYFGLSRRLRCRNSGLLPEICFAEPRSRGCSGQYLCKDCTSTKMECVCGGPHRNASRSCLVNKQAKKKSRLANSPALQPSNMPLKTW